jgi:xanthine dehydrogenase accessory factor
MNETRAVVEAFDAASARGERCALATVVDVEGSSYRRPGARMLVSATGATTGTISAGCLESDVVEHARDVMRTGAARLVEYDTAATSDDVAWELGLGCSGIVRVLVEPLAPRSLYMEALRRSCDAGPDASRTVATVYHCATTEPPDGAGISSGARLVVDGAGHVDHEKLSGEMVAMLEAHVRSMMRDGAVPVARSCHLEGIAAKVFVETLLAPVSLLVFGAGHDALPVVELARGLGWRTEVVDPKAREASRARFAVADRVTLLRPGDIGGQVGITPRTVTLLMSHDYAHDAMSLGVLLASPARYIGVMGPRERTERMLKELAASGATSLLDPTSLARLHAPAGLDIGANGPAEIALSIVAEMRALLDGRLGRPLRERAGPIHGGPRGDDAGDRRRPPRCAATCPS